MIVVNHSDEWFDLISSCLFFLSHSFGNFSWITTDTSDEGMTITSFIGTFIMGLEDNE